MTFREAAEASGVSHVTIYKVEKEGRIPRSDTLFTLCAWIGVKPDFFKRKHQEDEKVPA